MICIMTSLASKTNRDNFKREGFLIGGLQISVYSNPVAARSMDCWTASY